MLGQFAGQCLRADDAGGAVDLAKVGKAQLVRTITSGKEDISSSSRTIIFIATDFCFIPLLSLVAVYFRERYRGGLLRDFYRVFDIRRLLNQLIGSNCKILIILLTS